MGLIERRRVRGLIKHWAIIGVALAGAGLVCRAGSVILFDFEDGTEGWENEAIRPAAAQVSTTQARHGHKSLAFTRTFSKSDQMLHCRVKAGFPKDLSAEPSFLSFSAWIYIPKGKPNWQAKMFARSGKDWAWGEGRTEKNMEPGWHKVDITYDKIADRTDIEDIGVEVINFSEPMEATICIDQVEMNTRSTNALPAAK